MKSAQYDLNYIQSLAIQGRCRCGNVVESGATRCVDCKEKQNKSREAIEEARKNLGLCIKCAKPAEKQVVSDDHGEPIETALIYCKDHVEDNRRRQRRHHDAAIVRNRDRRRKLIADGKCVCGKPLEWKKKRCGECLERERVSAAIRRMRAKPRPQTVDQAKKTRHETTKVLGSLLMAITNAGGPPK